MSAAYSSVDAEHAVLGGLMVDNSKYDVIADVLTAEDFSIPEHRIIFSAIEKLRNKNSPFDAVTISEAMESARQLSAIGGLKYLGTLAKNTPTAANVRSYAEAVRERALRRALKDAGERIIELSGDRASSDSAEKLLDKAQAMVTELCFVKRESITQDMRGLLSRVITGIDERMMRGGDITGVPTGFVDLDNMTTGLHPGDLVIIGGRPGMGKTTAALCIAESVTKALVPTVFFSLEMTSEQLGERLISSIGGIDLQNIRRARLTESDWSRLNNATKALIEQPLYIDDSPSATVAQIRSKARRLKKEKNIGLIVIDYLQLVRGKGFNRDDELGQITRGLKALAKELRLPVIALSQLNREVENRTNKRPVLRDLRESGSIEQDADIICFVYRDEYYNENSPDKGIAELIIAKQRSGPTGSEDCPAWANNFSCFV